MAGRARTPKDQVAGTASPIPSYDTMSDMMISETTSILTDFYRQYVGYYGAAPAKPGDAIFINFDPVLQSETYQRWAQFDLYWYLEQDPHVRAILSAAKVNVAGLDWSVSPFLRGKEKKPSATNEAVAEFCEDTLEQLESFPQHLYDLMDALPKGFSFSEIVWAQKNGFWIIDRLMNRTQRRIQFDAVDRQPKIRTKDNPYYGERLQAGKYIVHRCSSTWENPFGDPLDQSLYWMWLFKKMGLKFFLKHIEVGSSSIPIVQHPTTSDPKLKDEAMQIAADIRNGAYGRMPDTMKVVWGEFAGKQATSEMLSNFIRLMNDEMTKCVKGSLLTTEGASSAGSGSRSMGQTHQVTEDQYDIFRAKGLAASINKYIIQFLVDYNFSTVEGYPRFKFDVEEEEDQVQASTVLANLTRALPDYEIDIDDVNDKFGYVFTKKEKEPLPGAIAANPLGAVNPNEPAPLPEFSGTQRKQLSEALVELSESIKVEDSKAEARIAALEQKKADIERSIKQIQKSVVEMSEENKATNVIERLLRKLIDKKTVVNVSPAQVTVPVTVKPAEFKEQPQPIINVNVPKQDPPIINVNVPKQGPKEMVVERDGMGYIKKVKSN